MSQELDHLLETHGFLAGLSSAQLSLLRGCATTLAFQPEEYLIRQGSEANSFFLLTEGRVSIEISAPGRGSIPIETIGAGDALGWSWLIPPHRWRFDARALAATRAVSLNGACLRAVLAEDHELGYQLLHRLTQVMVERLGATRMQLLDLYGAPGAGARGR